jgi:hypothetical protein
MREFGVALGLGYGGADGRSSRVHFGRTTGDSTTADNAPVS